MTDGSTFDRGLPLRLARDVRFRKVGGQGILVRQEAGEVLAVNGVAAEVLELLDPRRHPFGTEDGLGKAASGGRSSAAVVARLAERFDAPAEELARDVEDFLEELLEVGVVERTG